MVPNIFGTGDQFHRRQFSHGPGRRGWVVQDDSSPLHLLCTLFLVLLHQLQLRLSGIRFQRLGTPVPQCFSNSKLFTYSWWCLRILSFQILKIPFQVVVCGCSRFQVIVNLSHTLYRRKKRSRENLPKSAFSNTIKVVVPKL